VIQPFDSGKFDKRYEDTYAPAIVAANLEPYRVDHDPSVDIPIDSIEEGIRQASICLADITSDNPNVWYELGYCFASGTPVVMVCSDERSGRRYPFDIQHRTIIPYQSEAPRDFEVLKNAITKRIKALLQRSAAIRQIKESDPVAPVEGLSQPELVVLATVAGSIMLPEDGVSAFVAKGDVEKAGFTALGFSIGLRRLRAKDFVTLHEATDYSGEAFQVIKITESGWSWIEANEDKFMLRRPEIGTDDNSPF
jgi:hypothetical protein